MKIMGYCDISYHGYTSYVYSFELVFELILLSVISPPFTFVSVVILIKLSNHTLSLKCIGVLLYCRCYTSLGDTQWE